MILLLNSLAFAINSSYDQCLDKAQGTNAYMQECNENELKRLDKLLNKYYKVAMRNFGDEKKEKEKLKLAQKAWLKFRELDCKSQSHPMRDGTGEYTMYQSCMIGHLIDRIKTFKKFY